jgi:hypothetical protein
LRITLSSVSPGLNLPQNPRFELRSTRRSRTVD